MAFDYRTSICQSFDLVVLSATFELQKALRKSDIEVKMNENLAFRKAKQPSLALPNCGSVFRNPLNNYAGALIESLNLKGKTIGGAKVSCKHANFIINENNATSNDIKNLIKLIHEQVLNNYDIDLILEQEIIAWE